MNEETKEELINTLVMAMKKAARETGATIEVSYTMIYPDRKLTLIIDNIMYDKTVNL
jgi:hypothetical protein